MLLIIPLIITYVKRLRVDYRVNKVIMLLKKLGRTIALVAPIRFGKSSTAAAIIHYYEVDMQSECYSEMETIKEDLHFIDMNIFIDYLGQTITAKTSYLEIFNIVDNYISDVGLPDGIINNFLNNVRIYDLLCRYADNFRIIYFRNNYVCSKTYYYSHLTSSAAKELKDVTTKIKEIEESEEFYLERYLIIYEDETSIDNSSNKSTSKKDKENGRKEFKILFGQIFEETCRYINIKQYSKDEKADERRLIQSNLLLVDRSISNTGYQFNVYIMFIRKIVHLFSYTCFFIKKHINRILKKKYYETYEQYYNSINKTRTINNKLKTIDDFLFSQQYINVKINDYKSADDVGKVQELYFNELNLTLPIKYSYGVYKNHEYFYLLKKMSSMSKVKFSDVKNIKFLDDPEQQERQSAFLKKETNSEVEELKDNIVDILEEF